MSLENDPQHVERFPLMPIRDRPKIHDAWHLRFGPGREDLDGERVAVIKHPRVEEIFQWKQEQSRIAREDVFPFKRAEDRLAIGIIQALAENSTERELHTWISQLLNALDTASKANESTSESYKLELGGSGSVVKEAQKIPSERDRGEFLINCWVEALCTAEARVLGWLYKEFYGRPYSP